MFHLSLSRHRFFAGTDPPDAIRTKPCAVKECWIDPKDDPSMLDAIGSELQKQYETLQPSTK